MKNKKTQDKKSRLVVISLLSFVGILIGLSGVYFITHAVSPDEGQEVQESMTSNLKRSTEDKTAQQTIDQNPGQSQTNPQPTESDLSSSMDQTKGVDNSVPSLGAVEDDPLTATFKNLRSLLVSQRQDKSENHTREFNSVLRSIVDQLPEITVSTEKDKIEWNSFSLNRRGVGFDAYRFRCPLDVPADMLSIAAFAQAIDGCQVLSVHDESDVLDEQSFLELDLKFDSLDFPERNVVLFEQRMNGQLQPGKEYILWIHSYHTVPIEVKLAAILVPSGSMTRPENALHFSEALGVAFKRTDYEIVENGLKKALSAASILNYYGDIRSQNFQRIMNSISKSVPEIQVTTGDEPAHWNKFTLNENRLGFDFVRFRSPSDVPADMSWIFSSTKSPSWYILPAEGTMQGFQNYDQVANLDAENVELSFDNQTIYQVLGDGEIKPDQEYFIWFSDLGNEPLEFHLAMNLSSPGSKTMQNDIRVVSRNVGVRSRPTPSMPVHSMVPGGRVGYIGDVCFSPKGDFLAGNDDSLDVSLWDINSLKRIDQFDFVDNWIPYRITVSPDGRYLLAASRAQTEIRIWDIQTRDLIMSYKDEGDDSYRHLANVIFCPGRKLAVASFVSPATRDFVAVLDFEKEEPESKKFLQSNFMGGSIACSNDGENLITFRLDHETRSKKTGRSEKHYSICFISFETGKTVDSIKIGEKPLEGFTISPDNRYLAVGRDGTHSIDIWDVKTKEMITEIPVGKSLYSLKISQDNRFLAFCGPDSLLGVWDIKKQRMHNLWCGNSQDIFNVAFSPDGRFLAFAGMDGNHRLWEWNKFPIYQAISENINPKDSRKPHVTNSLGMTLNFITSGRFRMGTPESFVSIAPKEVLPFFQLKEDYSMERPLHGVIISKPFYMGKYEVTVGEFRQFVKATGYQTHAEKSQKGGSHIFEGSGRYQYRKDLNWKKPGFTQDENHPVVQVTYDDTVAFCQWLSKKEGQTYRLPTEAEWEYACRAGSNQPWHQSKWFARSLGNIADESLFKHSSINGVQATWDDGFSYTAQVGSFFPNAFGLFDMHGNVFEWCSDWFDSKYYEYSPDTDPEGPDSGKMRVQRGGAWVHNYGDARSAYRDRDTPDNPQSGVGFRVVLEIEETALEKMPSVKRADDKKPLHLDGKSSKDNSKVPQERSVSRSDQKEADSQLPEVPELFKLEGHKKAVYSVDVSQDGRWILSGGNDGLLRLWDAENGKQIRQFTGHKRGVGAVAFSPDGKKAISGSWDRVMRLWDIDSGKTIREFHDHQWPVLTVAISPDGKRALSGSDGFRLWDLESGQMLYHFKGHSKTVWSVSFSPDGKRVLTGSWDRTMRLWDLEDYQELRTFPGHTDRVKCVRFSPVDQLAASCDTADPIIRLWNTENGKLIRELKGHRNGVASVAFSENGRYLLSGAGQLSTQTGKFIKNATDKSIRLWEVATGQELLQANGHDDYVTSVAFTPDGQKAVSGSGDGTVRIWQLFKDGKK